MKIDLIRTAGKFNFEARNEAGFTVSLDANPAIGGTGKGFRPMEMLLVGLGGCSGIDIVNMLTKQKEPLNDVQIHINASRRENETPPIFDEISIQFEFHGALNPQKVDRAMALTFEKYCSVAKILSYSAKINYSYTINA